MINGRYYGTSRYKRIMKYLGVRPDVIVVQRDKILCLITDFACPYDGRVDTKELEKIKPYQDSAQELRKI